MRKLDMSPLIFPCCVFVNMFKYNFCVFILSLKSERISKGRLALPYCSSSLFFLYILMINVFDSFFKLETSPCVTTWILDWYNSKNAVKILKILITTIEISGLIYKLKHLHKTPKEDISFSMICCTLRMPHLWITFSDLL